MVLMGVNRTKIIVQDSGVNSRALERYPTRAKVWRDSLLRKSKYNYLAAYSGGMQTERGIAHILYAAEKMPDVMFAMAGGNGSDIAYWLTQARQMNLSNVRFLDYLPQDQVIELQQAADVVLMTREPGARGAISSPLKFFEYLASGTPVLAAATAVLHEKNTENLAVSWYNPEDPDRIIDALLGAFKKYPRKIEGYKANIAYASSYTWSERQKKIMAFADVDFVFPQAGDPS
jgi:glycosyltransferase involved in cell wall biosynthesis